MEEKLWKVLIQDIRNPNDSNLEAIRKRINKIIVELPRFEFDTSTEEEIDNHIDMTVNKLNIILDYVHEEQNRLIELKAIKEEKEKLWEVLPFRVQDIKNPQDTNLEAVRKRINHIIKELSCFDFNSSTLEEIDNQIDLIVTKLGIILDYIHDEQIKLGEYSTSDDEGQKK